MSPFLTLPSSTSQVSSEAMCWSMSHYNQRNERACKSFSLRVLCTATYVPDIGMHSIENALKSTDHKVRSLTK